jgi:alpha-beta hydrolase superfamily lysophospholipase
VWIATAAVVIAGLVSLTGCGGGHHAATRQADELHVTARGYTVPSPLLLGNAGALIAHADAPSLARGLGAARAWRLLYHSRDRLDRDIAVSAMLLVPHGPAPASGWPLVSWAHGTSGLADQCAPSIAPGLGNDKSAQREMRALLAQQFAVVASDYPGLGTPGEHTYLIGADDARAVIDAVGAAHALLGTRVSRSWVTVGHSEGGQTALFVAQAATARAPQWRFLGTVALAPASSLEVLIPFAEATHDPVEQAYLVYALAGLGAVEPSVRVESLLTPQAKALFPDTRTGCIDAITNDFARHHVTTVLAIDAATKARLNTLLGRHDDPDRARASGPILVAQGIDDADVPAAATDGMVTRMCAIGDHVQFSLYKGLDHNDLVAGSQPEVDAWIAARFAGGAASTNCPS